MAYRKVRLRGARETRRRVYTRFKNKRPGRSAA